MTCIKDTLLKYVTISTRSITDENIQSTDWSNINGSVSADQAYQTFSNKYLKIYDQIMPVDLFWHPQITLCRNYPPFEKCKT